MPRVATNKSKPFETILIAAAAFTAGYLIANKTATPPAKNTAANTAANAAVGYPRLPWNTSQPYNPDNSGYFNYATGGFPYSM